MAASWDKRRIPFGHGGAAVGSQEVNLADSFGGIVWFRQQGFRHLGCEGVVGLAAMGACRA